MANGSGGRLRLLLMGTGPFAVPSFEALRAAGHECALVLTRPERIGPGKKAASKSPVRIWAEGAGLPVRAPESVNSEEARELITEAAPDLLVVCDYGQILKAGVIGLAPLGGINLHGSLLPAFRGAAPVQWAMLSGAAETGVSVIHMTRRLDAGPVICQRRVAIESQETAGELEERLSQVGVDATLEAVRQLIPQLEAARQSGRAPEVGEVQTDTLASKAPRLQKADGRIDWTRTAAELDWHVRGMQPWPGAFTEVPAGPGRKQALRLQVLRLEPLGADLSGETPPAAEPGTVALIGESLAVRCGDGWLRVSELKPAGKRAMADSEWLRGRPLEAGVRLE